MAGKCRDADGFLVNNIRALVRYADSAAIDKAPVFRQDDNQIQVHSHKNKLCYESGQNAIFLFDQALAKPDYCNPDSRT